jgi:glycosyltransferase involved in cell wall biosynthesis
MRKPNKASEASAFDCGENAKKDSMRTELPTYVLITPARNEAAFLEQTIQSMVAQTVRPLKWVIVSDGSTDGTDEIAARYAAEHPWIELVRTPERRDRHFAGKVYSFNAGYERLAALDYEIIGNLDADVTFEPDYFDFLIRKFVENPQLGVGGTPFTEGSYQYDFRFSNIEHVSGQIQMFRRECYEDIGGYVPIKTGGVDLVAVTTARMKGWQTRTFLGKAYEHHRKMSSAKHSVLGTAFDGGRTDYTHGCDPVWQLFRSLYQITQRPFVLRGLLFFTGYFWAMITRQERVVSAELIQFRKVEQRRRLRAFFRSVPRWFSLHTTNQHQ